MLRYRYPRLIQRLGIFVLLVLFVPLFAYAQEMPVADEHEQNVRVRLTRLALTDRLDVTITSPYTLTTPEGVRLHFQKGSSLSFQLKNGIIYLYYQGMTQEIGQEFDLIRTGDFSDEMVGFYQTNFPALYMGDLHLDVREEKLRPILTIHVEDYLLGVVPYEMSDSFPVEALKAQAVAARTYALRSQNQYDDYDLVDNTNDQVFRGYIAGNTNAEEAVFATQGVCGFYQGELAQCYYSASNGGQMEQVETVWPTSDDFGYYTFGEDPYDLANPESVVRRFTFAKQYGDETAPYALRKLLAEKLSVLLTERGYDAAPESIRVDKVSSVVVDTPNMYESKLMTMLHLVLEISVRTRHDAVLRIVDNDTEEVSLFATAAAAPKLEPETTGAFAPVVTAVPFATPEPDYGPFVSWSEPVLIDMPIFQDAEDAFALDILANYDNEIWSVAEDENAFTLEVRRYGHGVGMSQRGAQWMAYQHGMTYDEILAFYYPGMLLMQYPRQERTFTNVDEALTATAGPAPSPTPRPTPMPVTLDAQEGQWYAEVTGIADDSSLNLRAEPTMNGQILTRLYKGQRLLVVERCPEEGWVHVKTDAIEGYVMESYLTVENQ